jgi:hypothetical protein
VHAKRPRVWARAAFVAAVVLLVTVLPTWGFSLLLAPISVALSVVAWFRSRRDGLFWTGVGLNGLLLLGFAAPLDELKWF